MSREDPQMKIRLPAELKDCIEMAAKQLGRSMNAEIIERLSQSFLPSKQGTHVVLDAKLNEVVSMTISIPTEAFSESMLEAMKPVLLYLSESAQGIEPAEPSVPQAHS